MQIQKFEKISEKQLLFTAVEVLSVEHCLLAIVTEFVSNAQVRFVEMNRAQIRLLVFLRLLSLQVEDDECWLCVLVQWLYWSHKALVILQSGL